MARKLELVLTHTNLRSEQSRDGHASGWSTTLTNSPISSSEANDDVPTPTIDHKTATAQEWRAARLELLRDEKDLTRRSDELARRRQALPWVRIEKVYRFETDEGAAGLVQPLQGPLAALGLPLPCWGRILQRAGCPSCSSIADGFNGIFVHLANHDVTLCAVSSAPIEKLQAYKRRMGWAFPGPPQQRLQLRLPSDVH